MTGKIIMNEKRTNKTISLNEIKSSEEKRLLTADPELNRVLGWWYCSGKYCFDCR